MTKVPPILHVYWRGREGPGWLRSQTLETFRRHHPGWEVRAYLDPGDEQRPGWWPDLAEAMPPDARSDVVRWCALEAEGGVFTDLDVLFLRRFSWSTDRLLLTTDGGTPEVGGGRAFAIGVVASPPGDPIVAELARKARSWSGTWNPTWSHQAFGTGMLAYELADAEVAAGRRTKNLSAGLLYPQGFLRQDNARLWDEDGPEIDVRRLLGLHWGGGHEMGRVAADAADEDWALTSNCLVARIWRHAMLGEAP